MTRKTGAHNKDSLFVRQVQESEKKRDPRAVQFVIDQKLRRFHATQRRDQEPSPLDTWMAE